MSLSQAWSALGWGPAITLIFLVGLVFVAGLIVGQWTELRDEKRNRP